MKEVILEKFNRDGQDGATPQEVKDVIAEILADLGLGPS
jgi:hypothetical protein